MQYTTLGTTGLRVSVAGLGCGGNSRLGLGSGKTENDAIRLVRAALDLGVNFFDTAEVYGTEAVLGRALAGVPRDSVVLSSKTRILDGGGNPLPSDAIAANLDMSLRTLQVEHIDVFHLHAVQAKHYDYALNELVRKRCAYCLANCAASDWYCPTSRARRSAKRPEPGQSLRKTHRSPGGSPYPRCRRSICAASSGTHDPCPGH
jgi:aryl-alcohol dehydrogenase-like predicted oxidoreductase